MQHQISNLPATSAIPLPVNRDVCSVCHVSRGALLDEALAPPVDGFWYGALAASMYTTCVTQHATQRITVPSSVPGKHYVVTITGGAASCQCADFTFRRHECKHLRSLGVKAS